MKWPFVKRSTMEAAIIEAQQTTRTQTNAFRDADIKKMKEEWEKKWQPLLEKSLRVRAVRRPELNDFVLHIGVDRNILEVAAMYNDESYWTYIADNLAYEFKRQMATLNFSGLHKLARDSEYRYRELSHLVSPWKD